MTPTEFELAVGDALRAVAGERPEARLVIEAAAGGGLDAYDLIGLVAGWVTAALDPDGTPPTSDDPRPAGFPLFRLTGLEGEPLNRWCRDHA